MDNITIYHNPRCSKSRAALALLEENDINPEIVYYLDTPPDTGQIKELLKKLGLEIRQLLRKSDRQYDALGLDNETLADEIILDLVSKHPKLIQRPIVVKGDRAIIGRPPEKVLELIGKEVD